LKDKLDLTPFSKVKAMNLSGGNIRKLVCAMSLIGCPSILFLDEPTTGVDPISSRNMLKMLKNLDECSIIFTTH
jgi:ABC-type multidrug transport system ATPase subunit